MNDVTVLWAGLLGCLLVVGYTYIGYPALLSVFTWSRSPPEYASFVDWPSVTMVVPAHNEASVIDQKLDNTAAIEYPGPFDCIIVSDSTDATDELVRRRDGGGVTLLSLKERRGKSYAVNRAVEAATGDVIVLSDANTLYEPNAVRELVGPLTDPSVGCTTGRLRLVSPAGRLAETAYWRYELGLRHRESRLGTTVSSNGGIMAIRRDQFEPLPPRALTDDLVVTLQQLSAGRRIVYVPGAVATEETARGLWDEFDRRVRIGAGNFQTLAWFPGLLLPGRGLVAIQFLSHKVLRWLAPAFLILVVILTLVLTLLAESPLAGKLLAAELGSLGFGLVGAANARTRRLAPFRFGAYFLVMNLALALGFVRFLTGPSVELWEPVRP